MIAWGKYKGIKMEFNGSLMGEIHEMFRDGEPQTDNELTQLQKFLSTLYCYHVKMRNRDAATLIGMDLDRVTRIINRRKEGRRKLKS